jgi:hypothetical protein
MKCRVVRRQWAQSGKPNKKREFLQPSVEAQFLKSCANHSCKASFSQLTLPAVAVDCLPFAQPPQPRRLFNGQAARCTFRLDLAQ